MNRAVIVGNHERRLIVTRMDSGRVVVELHRLNPVKSAHHATEMTVEIPQYGVFFVELSEVEAVDFARGMGELMGLAAKSAVGVIAKENPPICPKCRAYVPVGCGMCAQCADEAGP